MHLKICLLIIGVVQVLQKNGDIEESTIKISVEVFPARKSYETRGPKRS